MKIIAEYPAFVYDGQSSSIGDLVKFIHSPWPLNMDVKEYKVMGEFTVSFEYPNNEEAVIVTPGSIVYKGPYGAFQVIPERDLSKYPSLRLDRG